MFQPFDGRKNSRLDVHRHAGRQTVYVDFVGIDTFRLQKQLVSGFIRELNDFIFNRRAVSRPDSFDLAGIQSFSLDLSSVHKPNSEYWYDGALAMALNYPLVRSSFPSIFSDDYIRAIKAAFAADIPQYNGKYVSFSGATFSPRPVQRPHPPIWVGGSPGAISGPAVRRCAELGDAWHPLALGLDEIEKGYATLRDLASRTGRRDTLGLSPRNMLDLTDAAKGAGRAAFQGSVAEVAADIKRVRGIGAAWMTFDLPRAGIPAMVRAMERLAGEVKSAAA